MLEKSKISFLVRRNCTWPCVSEKPVFLFMLDFRFMTSQSDFYKNNSESLEICLNQVELLKKSNFFSRDGARGISRIMKDLEINLPTLLQMASAKRFRHTKNVVVFLLSKIFTFRHYFKTFSVDSCSMFTHHIKRWKWFLKRNNEFFGFKVGSSFW